jgi:hypothetical protein
MPNPVEGSLKGGQRTDVDFLVERPSREVLDRAEFYIWRRGFRMSLGDRTETTSLFTRMQVPRRTFLKTLLTKFNSAPTPVQKIRLVASEAGEGRTRLTVIESRQGEVPDQWTELKAELEQWVVEELGGTYWPL